MLIKRNPWTFLPILYFLQSMPVAVIQELSILIYKDLGIANEEITRWTSLLMLPWALQMILGPLVDTNFTKRWWLTTMQLVIAIGLGASAFLIGMPRAFEFTLVIFMISGLMSAICNAATDGFALLAMDKDEQAKFAGFMSTFYRLGRLFVVASIPMVVGTWTKMPDLNVTMMGGEIQVKRSGQVRGVTEAGLQYRNGLLGIKGADLEPPIPLDPGTYKMRVEPNGDVFATNLLGEKKAGTIPVPAGASLQVSAPVQGSDPRTAWTWSMALVALIYGGLVIAGRFIYPRPALDVKRNEDLSEVGHSVKRTLYLIGAGLSGYFMVNAIVRLSAHAFWKLKGADPEGPWKGWMIVTEPAEAANRIPLLGKASPLGLNAEIFQLCVCTAIFAVCLVLARRSIRGTEMGEALGSFTRQQGFWAILFFIGFYRLPEAMVGRITPLFLKDSLDKGGLAMPNDQFGVVSSFLGVFGIILGGILGGWVVSRIGLRRAFWPLALSMHVPNLLYLWASTGKMPMTIIDLDYPGPLNLTIGAITFVDQMGYGFGYAAYAVFLMWMAQRGNFRTAHYAIAVGLGALCIAMAGVLGGVIQANFNYTGVFIAVLIGSIPGLISILLVPLDDSHRKIKVQVE